MENEILVGDCAETLKKYPDETFDCIVTDPPYGYSFMGKQWDKALPSLEALKECHRVLKSGAFGFFMSAPRQDVLSRMILRLEEAGFQTGFTSIYWVYASGFPKSAAMDKLIDNRFGVEREVIGNKKRSGSAYMKEQEHYQMDNGKAIDGRDSELIRIRVESMKQNGVDITAPATEQAKQFEGSFAGFQPKPALEIIIVCMKSLSKKTYVDQALTNGKGVTWLGDCRIPYESDDDNKRSGNKESSETSTYGWAGTSSIYKSGERNDEGRFPANLLVSDNVLDRGIIDKGTKPHPLNSKTDKYEGWGSSLTKKTGVIANYGDSGDFSRYFDLDAWFKSKLPEQAQKTYPYLIVAKPSKGEKNKYCENKHPTVKPLKLMSYLITMGSREGDLILDPFAGSGTTCEAARLLNRKFVGCEMSEEYLSVLEARSQVTATRCPYRNIIEVCDVPKTIEELENSLEGEEQNSYYNLLLNVPAEHFEMVRRAYWTEKGLKI